MGAELVRERHAQGLTQSELAQRVGVRQPQIARWERVSYRTTSLERLDAVAAALRLAGPTRSWLAAEDQTAWGKPDVPSDGASLLARIGVTSDALEAFARRHDIVEIGLFGSALRGDFRADSDIDLLVRYAPGSHRGIVDLEREHAELTDLTGRAVDVLTRAAVERMTNPLRRRSILSQVRSLYVA
jgi:predicted nucleotidyltransferase/DNA-binding XRE family transcriptional regulator